MVWVGGLAEVVKDVYSRAHLPLEPALWLGEWGRETGELTLLGGEIVVDPSLPVLALVLAPA